MKISWNKVKRAGALACMVSVLSAAGALAAAPGNDAPPDLSAVYSQIADSVRQGQEAIARHSSYDRGLTQAGFKGMDVYLGLPYHENIPSHFVLVRDPFELRIGDSCKENDDARSTSQWHRCVRLVVDGSAAEVPGFVLVAGLQGEANGVRVDRELASAKTIADLMAQTHDLKDFCPIVADLETKVGASAQSRIFNAQVCR
jgi:hypothetical protein